jgi:hypothetical protein
MRSFHNYVLSPLYFDRIISPHTMTKKRRTLLVIQLIKSLYSGQIFRENSSGIEELKRIERVICVILKIATQTGISKFNFGNREWREYYKQCCDPSVNRPPALKWQYLFVDKVNCAHADTQAVA